MSGSGSEYSRSNQDLYGNWQPNQFGPMQPTGFDQISTSLLGIPHTLPAEDPVMRWRRVHSGSQAFSSGAFNFPDMAFKATHLYLFSLFGQYGSVEWATGDMSMDGPGSSTVSEIFRTSAIGDTRGMTVWAYVPAVSVYGHLNLYIGSDNMQWGFIIDETFNDIAPGGTNGSAAIKQMGSNFIDFGAPGPLTVTLSAFSDVHNGTYGLFATNGATGWAAGAGFTSLGPTLTTISRTALSEYRIDNDTSVTVDWTSSDSVVWGFAMEIAPIVPVAPTSIWTPQILVAA